MFIMNLFYLSSSREYNLATAGAVLEPLAEIFPDVQVVPSLGNHEPFPCNM